MRELDELGEHEVAENTNVVIIFEAGNDAVVELLDGDGGEGGVEEGVEGFVGRFADFKAVVDFVLERSHLDFTDELGTDLGFAVNQGEKASEMGKDEVGLVVSGGVEGSKGKAPVFDLVVFNHLGQEGDDNRTKQVIVRSWGVRQSVAEGRNDDTSGEGIARAEVIEEVVEENLRIDDCEASQAFSSDGLRIVIPRNLEESIPDVLCVGADGIWSLARVLDDLFTN